MVYKTKGPVGLYLLIASFLFSAFYLIYAQMNIEGIIFYLTLLAVFGLWGLKMSFIVKVYQHHFEIIYLNVFKKKVSINFKDLHAITMEKGVQGFGLSIGRNNQNDFVYFDLHDGKSFLIRPYNYTHYNKLIAILHNKMEMNKKTSSQTQAAATN